MAQHSQGLLGPETLMCHGAVCHNKEPPTCDCCAAITIPLLLGLGPTTPFWAAWARTNAA
jgi:hypothetical protein